MPRSIWRGKNSTQSRAGLCASSTHAGRSASRRERHERFPFFPPTADIALHRNICRAPPCHTRIAVSESAKPIGSLNFERCNKLPHADWSEITEVPFIFRDSGRAATALFEASSLYHQGALRGTLPNPSLDLLGSQTIPRRSPMHSTVADI